MKQLTANNKTLIFVEVPKDASDFRIETGNYNVFVGFNKDAQTWIGNTPMHTEIEILSTLSAITDEQCEEFVLPVTKIGSGLGDRYFDYSREWDYVAMSAKDSFLSLLKSKGIVTKGMVDEPNVSNEIDTQKKYNSIDKYEKWKQLPDELLVVVKK